MADQSMLEIVNQIQLHHARLLYIISELYYRSLIKDEQKLAIKFGVFNDDSKLMDFYFEANGVDGGRLAAQRDQNQIFDAPFEELSNQTNRQLVTFQKFTLDKLQTFC